MKAPRFSFSMLDCLSLKKIIREASFLVWNVRSYLTDAFISYSFFSLFSLPAGKSLQFPAMCPSCFYRPDPDVTPEQQVKKENTFSKYTKVKCVNRRIFAIFVSLLGTAFWSKIFVRCRVCCFFFFQSRNDGKKCPLLKFNQTLLRLDGFYYFFSLSPYELHLVFFLCKIEKK